ncbi:hypothetical protein G6O67_001088 [Ophiocordyceps sinensis]|uniref:Uncharacterized protein n=1 Tax=Ophiocordyceps sinensis TaxID=72228 RepID=A0A8H4PWM6_9HYPO|nr:hypothetical protein G6O67_001088 [Ophiocordyceps sinensis]
MRHQTSGQVRLTLQAAAGTRAGGRNRFRRYVDRRRRRRALLLGGARRQKHHEDGRLGTGAIESTATFPSAT